MRKIAGYLTKNRSGKVIGIRSGTVHRRTRRCSKARCGEFKIAYLKKMKEVLGNNQTAQAFMDDMKKDFPGLPGETGLEELSEALYK